MATTFDVDTVLHSGYNHIDALLDEGPSWNYVTGDANTIYFTFSITEANQTGKTGQQAFSAAQQAYARTAMAYLHTVTGINFVEVANGSTAEVHLANIDIDGATTSGLCHWDTNYSYNRATNELTTFSAEAYVYLDDNEFRTQNADLTPGGEGYETLLHELGHMLGLKHPFEDLVQLPSATNNTAYTLMAYNDSGGPYSTYRQYDLATLAWLYGGDGLGGALGLNSDTGARYLMGTNSGDNLIGTAFNDKLEGDGGNDIIDGGDGFDTVVYTGARASYAITRESTGYKVVDARGTGDGADALNHVENLQFSDSAQSVEYYDAVQALYIGYFGRAADSGGLASFQSQLAQLGAPHDIASLAAAYGKNAGITGLIDSFSGSAESASLYTGDARAFVTAIFHNVLNRAPLTGGLEFWANAITSGDLSPGDAALSIMNGALKNTSPGGLLDAALVNNKIAVASDFTLAMNTSSLVAAYSGHAAAATVRSMLDSVTSSTDLTAFQSTISSTLSALVAAHAASEAPPQPDLAVSLVGQAHHGMLWLA
jgi:serralysin